MLISTWVRLRPFMPGGRGGLVGLHAGLAFAGGLLEAVLLVLVVSAGLAVAEGDVGIEVSAPIVGEVSTPLGSAVIAAGVAGLLLVVLHLFLALIASRLGAQVMAATRRRLVDAYTAATWDR